MIVKNNIRMENYRMNDKINAKTIESPGELSPAEQKKWLDPYNQLDHQTRLKVIYLFIDRLHSEPASSNSETR